MRKSTWCLCLLACCAVGAPVGASGGASEGEPPAEPPVPALSESQKLFLSRVARRTVEDAYLRRGMYEPGYVPSSLGSLEHEALVQLRLEGYLLGAGVGGPGPVVEAVRDAAITAVDVVRDRDLLPDERVGNLLIEIELVGEARSFTVAGSWAAPGALNGLIEPGVHGMAISGPRGTHRFVPSELFTADLVLHEALDRLAQHTHGQSGAVGQASLQRFRTLHWYLPPDSDEVVTLQRGLVPVPPEAVGPRQLDEAINHLAEYMAYRQLSSGLFSYQFEAGLNHYSTENSLVRQLGAVQALAVHARWSGKSASRGAVDLALRYHVQGLTALPGVDDASFLATADGQNKLGVTSMAAQVMALYPEPEKYAATREKLVNGILWLQRPSGMFITAFPPAETVEAQAQFPGEALLALALQYEQSPSGKILEAFSRAIEFYRGLFRDREDPAMIAWQMQAYASMARMTRRDDYASFVFELADWLCKRQLTEDNCRWPEMHGGFAAYMPGQADISTASYLEGLCDAIRVAHDSGDEERAKKYEQAARRAARFVLQLQVKPQEAYFMRSPRDAVWGARRTPTLNVLTISHSQHALVSLIKVREALYGAE